MENRKTKKPNDPLLCRKKESKRGFEVPKKPIMCLRKKTTSKYTIVIKKKICKVWKKVELKIVKINLR